MVDLKQPSALLFPDPFAESGRENFDRYFTVQSSIGSTVDFADAAGAQQAYDVVRANATQRFIRLPEQRFTSCRSSGSCAHSAAR